jgi:DNA-binding XRE family transcriptional regulator
VTKLAFGHVKRTIFCLTVWYAWRNNRGMEHALTTYRLSAKVSREQIAKAVGTSRQTIYRIESWQQMPSLDLVSRIIEATGRAVSAYDFLRRETEAAQ